MVREVLAVLALVAGVALGTRALWVHTRACRRMDRLGAATRRLDDRMLATQGLLAVSGVLVGSGGVGFVVPLAVFLAVLSSWWWLRDGRERGGGANA